MRERDLRTYAQSSDSNDFHVSLAFGLIQVQVSSFLLATVESVGLRNLICSKPYQLAKAINVLGNICTRAFEDAVRLTDCNIDFKGSIDGEICWGAFAIPHRFLGDFPDGIEVQAKSWLAARLLGWRAPSSCKVVSLPSDEDFKRFASAWLDPYTFAISFRYDLP